MSKNNFKLEYDKAGDILYISRGQLTKEDTSEELGMMWLFGKIKKPKKFLVLQF